MTRFSTPSIVSAAFALLTIGCSAEPSGVVARATSGNAQVFGATSALGAVSAGDLILTELMVNPNGFDNPQEWFEIHNLNANAVDLDGLVITESVAPNAIVVSGTLIVPSGGYVVLGENLDPAVNGGVNLDYAYGNLTMPLFNPGGNLTLAFGTTTFDSVAYDDLSWPLEEGHAFALDDAFMSAAGNDSPAAWCDAWGAAYGSGGVGSPGVANPDCDAKDLDGDGAIDLAWGGDDCDDTNAAIYPSAIEDGGDLIDNNCTGFLADHSAADLTTADLLLTEILVNPDATTDGYGEWFEFRVDHSSPIDLKGLVVEGFVGGTGSPEQFTITDNLLKQPGDYVVFAVNDDPALNGNVIADWDWSGFNLYNNSDLLELRTPGGALIDGVAWDNGATFPDPTGAAMVLEPTLPYATATNNDLGSSWCVANVAWAGSAGDFGSPGAPNQSCLDRDGDGVASEQFGGTDCDDDNAAIYPGATEIEDNGVDENCDGRDALLGFSSLSPGDLVITEIHKEPGSVGSLGEWFEVYNNSANRVDLIGLTIAGDGSGSPDIFDLDIFLVLDPGEYGVIARDDNPAANGGVNAQFDWVSGWGLSNFDDTITLLNGALVIDTVVYDNSTFPDIPGATQSLEPTLTDATSNDASGSWCDGYTPFGTGGDLGSPGMANPICIGRDVDGDSFIDAEWGGDDCDDRAAGVHPGAVELPNNGVDENCDGSDSVIPLSSLAPGSLILTEVMTRPSGVAGSRGEWFEVLNLSGAPVDLNGLVFKNNSQTSMVDQIIYVEDGEYALFVTHSAPTLNGDLPYTYPPGSPTDYHFEFVGFTLYDNTNSLSLWSPDSSTLFDSIAWGASFPNTRGSSFQLDPAHLSATANDDGSNWCIGRDVIGATTENFGSPGQPNLDCTWTMDFTFNYTYTGSDPTLGDFTGSTTIELVNDGTFTTGNLGEGTGDDTSTASGQTVTWTYAGTSVTYVGGRAFGDACYAGTINNTTDYTATWSGCEAP